MEEISIKNGLESSDRFSGLLRNVLYFSFLGVLLVVCYLGYLCNEGMRFRDNDLGTVGPVSPGRASLVVIGPDLVENWSVPTKSKSPRRSAVRP